MEVWEAALWGLAGGAASDLVSLMTAVHAAGFRFPWKGSGEDRGARLFVLAIGLMLGALVAAAASGQMSGAWPAFLLGIAAPSTVRGVLGGVEYAVTKPESPPDPSIGSEEKADA